MTEEKRNDPYGLEALGSYGLEASGPLGIPASGSPLGGVFSSGSTPGDYLRFIAEPNYELQAKLLKKDAELATLKKEYLEHLAKKDRDNQHLGAKLEELKKKDRLRNILMNVEDAAQVKLVDGDTTFENLFSKQNDNAYVMSVDIRKSTDLMLKAVKPRCRILGRKPESHHL